MKKKLQVTFSLGLSANSQDTLQGHAGTSQALPSLPAFLELDKMALSL